jgi:hypothetical protein
VAMAPPGTEFADLARPVMGPDYAAVAIPVAIVARIAVIGRRVIDAPMEVTPVVIEMGPVIRVTISVAITAATVDRRCAKTATAENVSSAKTAAVDCETAAPESAAVKCRAAAAETAMAAASAETATAAASKASAATAKAAATMATATVPNFGRQPIGNVFRSRSRAGTCKRQRLSALL